MARISQAIVPLMRDRLKNSATQAMKPEIATHSSLPPGEAIMLPTTIRMTLSVSIAVRGETFGSVSFFIP